MAPSKVQQNIIEASASLLDALKDASIQELDPIRLQLIDRLPELICRHVEAIDLAGIVYPGTRDRDLERRVWELCRFHQHPSDQCDDFICIFLPDPEDEIFAASVSLPDCRGEPEKQADAKKLSDPIDRSEFSASLRATLAPFPTISLVRIFQKVATFWLEEFNVKLSTQRNPVFLLPPCFIAVDAPNGSTPETPLG